MTHLHTLVLLVDDEIIHLRLGETFLARLGVDIQTAQSGNQAIAAIESGPSPNLVVTDLNMPDGSGIDLLQFLRQHSELGSVPVIVVSGTTKREEIETVESLGCTFFKKPVNYNILLDQVALSLGMKVRQAIRFKVELVGTLHLREETMAVKTGDMSVLGVFIETPIQLELGTRCLLSLDFPEPSGLGQLRFEVELARESRITVGGRAGFGYGARILDNTEYRKKALHGFLKTLPEDCRV